MSILKSHWAVGKLYLVKFPLPLYEIQETGVVENFVKVYSCKLKNLTLHNKLIFLLEKHNFYVKNVGWNCIKDGREPNFCIKVIYQNKVLWMIDPPQSMCVCIEE